MIAISTAYQASVNNFIKNQPLNLIRYKGTYINAKWLEGLRITVKVSQNLFDKGFFNGDICEVLAELENGNLWIKRLEDNHQDIVDKKYLRRAEWQKYDF